jgi:hypothetical protein
MKYLLIMWSGDDAVRGGAEDLQAWVDFQEAATEAGVYVDGAQLDDPVSGQLVTTTLSAGVEQEPQDVGGDPHRRIVGYYLIDVPDADAALEWARALPLYGDVEVRALVQY